MFIVTDLVSLNQTVLGSEVRPIGMQREEHRLPAVIGLTTKLYSNQLVYWTN